MGEIGMDLSINEGCNLVLSGFTTLMNVIDEVSRSYKIEEKKAKLAQKAKRKLSSELEALKKNHYDVLEKLQQDLAAARSDRDQALAQAKDQEARAVQAREELALYREAEPKRLKAFQETVEFKQIVVGQSFKYVAIGFNGYKECLEKTGLLPEGRDAELPNLQQFVDSLPEDV